MFVDDSQFELAEVGSACPEVKTLLAGRYLELTALPECQGQETERRVPAAAKCISKRPFAILSPRAVPAII